LEKFSCSLLDSSSRVSAGCREKDARDTRSLRVEHSKRHKVPFSLSLPPSPSPRGRDPLVPPRHNALPRCKTLSWSLAFAMDHAAPKWIIVNSITVMATLCAISVAVSCSLKSPRALLRDFPRRRTLELIAENSRTSRDARRCETPHDHDERVTMR